MLRDVIAECGGIAAFLLELAAFGLLMLAILAVTVMAWAVL